MSMKDDSTEQSPPSPQQKSQQNQQKFHHSKMNALNSVPHSVNAKNANAVNVIASNAAEGEDGEMTITTGITQNHNPGRHPKSQTRPKTSPSALTHLKHHIAIISSKTEEEKTPEEIQLLNNYERRRRRKNERSRERTKENKREMIRIMALPEKERSKKEQEWLAKHLKAKKRKNWKDRERRKRIKLNGSVSGNDINGGNRNGDAGLMITESSSSLMSSVSMNSSPDLLRSETYTSIESNCNFDCDYDNYDCDYNYTNGKVNNNVKVEGLDDNFDGNLPPSSIRITGCEQQQQMEGRLSPSFLLHLASVIESPGPNHDSSHNSNTTNHTSNTNGYGNENEIDRDQLHLQGQPPTESCTLRSSFFDASLPSMSTSPIRLPMQREPGRSRSSIFRLKKP